VYNKNPKLKLQPTWENFLHILRDQEVNLEEIAGQIDHCLRNTGSSVELSGELQLLISKNISYE
jgi:hypothetical protein